VGLVEVAQAGPDIHVKLKKKNNDILFEFSALIPLCYFYLKQYMLSSAILFIYLLSILSSLLMFLSDPGT